MPLSEKPSIVAPFIETHKTNIYTQYSILFDNCDTAAKQPIAQGVPTAVPYSVPLNQQPVYKDISEGVATPISDEITRHEAKNGHKSGVVWTVILSRVWTGRDKP